MVIKFKHPFATRQIDLKPYRCFMNDLNNLNLDQDVFDYSSGTKQH